MEEAPAAPPDLTVPAGKTVAIGLTGEPGAGKSSLAQEFARLGASVIDVDALGHEVIEGPATKKKLVETFGADILDADGAVARAKLAEKAFASAESVADLNRIVHPMLTRKAKAAVKKAGNFLVIDAALLHELGLDEGCTQTVYVRAPREARLRASASPSAAGPRTTTASSTTSTSRRCRPKASRAYASANRASATMATPRSRKGSIRAASSISGSALAARRRCFSSPSTVKNAVT